MSELYELKLNITARDNKYFARWTTPDSQPTDDFELVLPIDDKASADLQYYLEEYSEYYRYADVDDKGQQIEKSILKWGRELFDAVFQGGEGKDVFRNLMEAARSGDYSQCLITIGTQINEVLVQPWEMMRDRRGPLVFQGVTIRRQAQGADRPRQFSLGLPLRVLLIVSRPDEAGFIDPRNSIPPLLDALESLGGQAELSFCEPATLAELKNKLDEARRAKRPYHIVHFDGHGNYNLETGVGVLAFERDEDNDKVHPVRGTELGDQLVRMEVPLVVLEACRSSSLTKKAIFGSVAPALLQSGVGSVIAFSHSVHVRAARLFVEHFYKELIRGATVGQAVEEARGALHASPGRFLNYEPDAEHVDLQDWFIPQLYQVGADPVLVDPSLTAALPAEKKKPLAESLFGFPPPPRYHFHGRARELLQLERAFRGNNGVVLSGMGGMGKTALAGEAARWWRHTGRFDLGVFHSFEFGAGAERVVGVIGEAVEGVDFASHPPQEQRWLAVRYFHEKKMLLVWDNFESTLPQFVKKQTADGKPPVDAEVELPLYDTQGREDLRKLYRDLTEGKAEGRLLVTCRPQETGLAGIKELQLEGLARADSLHLAAAVLEQKSIPRERRGDRAAMDALLDLLQDHPLSIELVAPHLKDLAPGELKEQFRTLLASFKDDSSFEGRNRSLLASLDFSKQRLGTEAHKALPYLAWFSGGMFENFFLAFSEMTEADWQTARAELESTALLRVETMEGFNTPYLRLHPTLAFATSPSHADSSNADVPPSHEDGSNADALPSPSHGEGAGGEVSRFIAVYNAVSGAIGSALRGAQPAAGMRLAALEEANLRAAMRLAFQSGERYTGGSIGGTLGVYLQMSGRLRERDALVGWVQERAGGGTLDDAACDSTLQFALSLPAQGKAGEAVKLVQDLIQHLEKGGLADGSDPAYSIALGYAHLGLILQNAGRSDLAEAPSRQAIAMFEALGDAKRDNLSAALGVLANALMALGRLEEALQTAQRGQEINRELGKQREIANSLGICGAILTDMQRYAEAETHYHQALDVAQAAGDLKLRGSLLQNLGILRCRLDDNDGAVDFYRQALARFGQAGDRGSEMRTCDLLGSAERARGELEAAGAWYRRSLELAEALHDRRHKGVTLQNLGILYQTRAVKAADAAGRAGLLRQAVEAVQHSLEIWLEMKNQPYAAASYSQLGVFYLSLGELDQAEEHSKKALRIREGLGLPDVYKDYWNLAEVARARGDESAASAWQAKHDAKLEELKRLRRGPAGEGGQAAPLSKETYKVFLSLCRACYQARANESSLTPQEAEAVAKVASAAPPLGAVGAFLKAVAEGADPLPPLPSALPQELTDMLQGLLDAIG